jgi:hypothetical protein
LRKRPVLHPRAADVSAFGGRPPLWPSRASERTFRTVKSQGRHFEVATGPEAMFMQPRAWAALAVQT